MVDLALSAARLLVAFLLVFANGFFVAAEFAFVRIRSSAVETFVEEGRSGSGALAEAIENLDDYLAVTQLGITIASIGLGWIGEPAVAALIEPVFAAYAPTAPVHLISFALGFAFVTFLHVVFGELAPKTISIARTERMALLVAPPMKVCYYLFLPGIVVFNGTANFFTSLIGVPPASETDETLTEREILTVLSRSGREGHVAAEEVEMIERVFALDDVAVREVMVPRPDAVSVPSDLPLSDLVSLIGEVGHTRYPVLDAEDGERVVGFVDAKDVLRAVASTDDSSGADDSSRPETAGDLARDIPVVPESGRLDGLLRRFQAERVQLAAVIDEWGAFEGLVTVEDVVERLVGDLWDAFDADAGEPSIDRRADGAYVIDGAVSLADANDALDAEFTAGEYGTVAGLVLDRLGRAPEVGDRVTADGHALTVEEVDGARIGRVVVREESAGDSDGAAESSEARDE